MKGADNIKLTINIGGEPIKIDVPFDDQNEIRDTERDIKSLFDKIKKNWPDDSNYKILAMVSFQFARWYRQLLMIQNEAIEIAGLQAHKIDELLSLSSNESL